MKQDLHPDARAPARPPPPAARRRRRGRRGGAQPAATGCRSNESFVETLKSARAAEPRRRRRSSRRSRRWRRSSAAPTSRRCFAATARSIPRDADYVGAAQRRLRRLPADASAAWSRSRPSSRSTQLRALPSRTQITRHDCVEGWSCIGKWKGVPLGADPRPGASRRRRRSFVVFRCFDSMDGPSLDGRDSRYYESIDLDDAHHAQTILAYELNDKPLPVINGAPLRCRVERQLGYKQAKYVRAIELVESFAAHPRRQGRLLGGRGLRVVRRDLTRRPAALSAASSRRRGCSRARRG